jgi:small subunit ribosomal protein S8
MLTDNISDFLTRIRNAGKARLSKVDAMNTRMNKSIADILVKEGYLKSYKEVQDGNKTLLRVYLRFEGGDLKKPVIQGLRRISKPGLRKYCPADKLPRVMSGFGMAIISTSQGVISEKEARTKGVGGEVLCSVW